MSGFQMIPDFEWSVFGSALCLALDVFDILLQSWNGSSPVLFLTNFRSDASFEALKLKLASVMPTGSSECHAINDDASHPASATATVQRVSAPPPHLPALVEDSNRKSSGDAATISTGNGNGSISSSQDSENKKKDDRQAPKRCFVFVT